MNPNEMNVPVASSTPMTAPVSIPMAPNLPNLNASLPIAFPGMSLPGGPGGFPGVPLMPPRLPMMPGVMPGMPLPGGLPFLPPRLPFPLPGRALPAAGGNANAVVDPNNDITCWSEHTSEEGRKYWYNSVTFISTYEKPFCLKTPEERSIPPCPWKEYYVDGKVYYSDGKESRWDMPEEFRLWKEKVEALEKKLQEEKLQQKLEKGNGGSDKLNNPGSSNSGNSGNQKGIHPSLSKSNSVQNLLLKSKSEDPIKDQKPTYATQAEAMEAFKELLTQKNISTIAKMKEVQDLCQQDPRWEALKTMGERKQALAEYQTKRLKLEKEAAKQKARKHKDAFLLMLAENTDIDARTKWRDAIEILKDDIRYKNVEDPREREELFRDFLMELEKKEREDYQKQKQRALEGIEEILQYLTTSSTTTTSTTASGITSSLITKHLPTSLQRINMTLAQLTPLTSQSNWNDYRLLFNDLLTSRMEFKILNEQDCRKYFLDYLHRLEEKVRLEEKRKREDHHQAVDKAKYDLRELLEGLLKLGEITAFTRWKEFQQLPAVIAAPAYQQLHTLLTVTNPAINSNSNNPPPTTTGASAPTNRYEEEFMDILHDMFDRLISRAQDQYKDDRRVIKNFLWDHRIDLTPGMKYSEFKQELLRKCQLVEKANPVTTTTTEGKEEKITKEEFEVARDSANPVSSTTTTKPKETEHPEEGEEIEVPTTTATTTETKPEPTTTAATTTGGESKLEVEPVLSEIQVVLLQRPFHLKEIFEDLYDKMIQEYEEEKKKQKKLEDKYISLLKDYFYLSDHVGIKWEDAKGKLQGRSAYEALARPDRKRLYYQYMDELSEKLKQKALAMKQYESSLEPGELVNPSSPLLPPAAANSQTKESRKRERERSNSSTEFEKLVRMKK